MKRIYLIIILILVGVSALWSQHANVVWNTSSRNSSESMPCGGGDIGMNVWVELKLNDGFVEISAEGTRIQIWADVFHPVVHVEIVNARPLQAEIFYENWRYRDRPIRKGEGQQCSYKWAPPQGNRF